MFAAGLVLERDPLQWAQMPEVLKTWVQGAGVVAAVGLCLWGLTYWLGRAAELRYFGIKMSALVPHTSLVSKTWTLTSVLFVGGAVLAGFFYLLAIGWLVLGLSMPDQEGSVAAPPGQPGWFSNWPELFFTLGGLCALLAVLAPLVVDLATRFRAGRIWALARLSLKEAFRRRIIWGFSVMAVIFLFADWFVPYKHEDQVRNYVRVIYWSLTPLFLLIACWLGAFGIPTEVRNQSIHTIVTKPVERFEIVLGRFLGYAILLTGGLAVLTGISLLYVLREIRPEAKQESYTARVPIFPDQLTFIGTKDPRKGENVGRVWNYRGYIGGPDMTPGAPGLTQYAVWSFERLPIYFDNPDLSIYFEFTFDIFRLTKGQEDRSVIADFTFTDGRLPLPMIGLLVKELLEKVRYERTDKQEAVSKEVKEKESRGEPEAKVREWQLAQLNRIEEELIDKYGIYRVSDQVLDYHTQSLGGGERKEKVGQMIARLFKKLRKQESGSPSPALHVLVNVDPLTGSQMLGVAKRDLYVLAAEGPFWLNFVKGIIGMWFTVLLILGIAVAASTYLSGVISFLVTGFLFGVGYFKDNIQQMLSSRGGGPLESAYKLLSGSSAATPLEQSPTTSLLQGGDQLYRAFMNLCLNVIPDVNRFDLHQYVANGFDISWSQVLMLDNLVPLAGFLLPCAVLAFYLMKFREVANPT